ncbi:hypothetical protein ABGB19_25755 [Mycobacterium sp. B14F4]
MESSDLFSHPQKPEFVSNKRSETEPVKNPEFSDGKTPSAKPTQ